MAAEASDTPQPDEAAAASGTDAGGGGEEGDVDAASSIPPTHLAPLEHATTPSSQKWYRVFDPASRGFYFFNEDTQESTWETPPGFIEEHLSLSLLSMIRLQAAIRRYIAKKRVERERGYVYGAAAPRTDDYTAGAAEAGGADQFDATASTAAYTGARPKTLKTTGSSYSGLDKQLSPLNTPAGTIQKHHKRCKICRNNRVYVVCMPCHHMSACDSCFASERDDRTGEFTCPKCMGVVEYQLTEADYELRAANLLNHDEWAAILEASWYIQTYDEWDCYQDSTSLAYFYMNRETRVCQWESPFDEVWSPDEQIEHKDKHKHDQYAYEGLDDEHGETAWVPPDIEIAKGAARAATYSAGLASIWATTPADLAMLGVGITLYFRLLKYLASVMIVMTLVALPLMILFSEGSRIPADAPDPLRFSSLSLGNLGSDDEAFTVSTNFNSSSLFTGTNETYATILGRSFTTVGTSYFIAFTDFVNACIFLLFLLWLHRRMEDVIHTSGRKAVKTSDFAVFVRGLPRDATEEGVKEHFDGLFRLDKPDQHWLDSDDEDEEEEAGVDDSVPVMESGPKIMKPFVSRRHMLVYTGQKHVRRTPGSPIGGNSYVDFDAKDLRRVEDVGHIHDPKYVGSWCAEVTIVHPIAESIRKYLDIQRLTSRLRQARAKIKLYSDSTPHPDGPNAEKKAEAEATATRLGFEMNQVRAKLLEREGEAHDECYAAFVVFNQEESYLRAIRAYERSGNWFWRFFQHERLRYQGEQRLNVQRATDPSDILWENMETTSCQGRMRRAATFFATLLVMVLSFALILSAQIARQRFTDQVPNLSLCKAALPTAFIGSYENASKFDTGALRMTRPGQMLAGEADRACQAFGVDRVHLTYEGIGVEFDYAACEGAYNVAAALRSAEQGGYAEAIKDPGCPDRRRDVQCPCFDPGASAFCDTLPCHDESLVIPEERECEQFVASTVVGCYCLQAFSDYVEELGAISGASEFTDKEDAVCGDWAGAYALAQSLTLVAAGAVSVTNAVLKIVMHILVRYEHHKTISSMSTALFQKIFLAQFINTAIIIVVVHSALPIDPDTGERRPSPIPGLFEGEFDGFQSGWYATVGSAISLTMLVNVFVPHLGPLFAWLVVQRANKRKAETMGKYLTQADMNKAFTGYNFALAIRYPEMMNTLFTTLLYCAGMPYLLPMAAGSFLLSYWIDKVLLLRFYEKPPSYDENLARHAMSWMPYALLMHLGTAFWMFGEDTITKSLVINPAIISDQTGGSEAESLALYEQWVARSESIDGIGLTPKILRVNSFPFFVSFIMLAMGMLFFKTIGRTCIFVIKAVWRKQHAKVAPNRKWLSPFTDEFAKILDEAGDAKPDDSDEEEESDDDGERSGNEATREKGGKSGDTAVTVGAVAQAEVTSTGAADEESKATTDGNASAVKDDTPSDTGAGAVETGASESKAVGNDTKDQGGQSAALQNSSALDAPPGSTAVDTAPLDVALPGAGGASTAAELPSQRDAAESQAKLKQMIRQTSATLLEQNDGQRSRAASILANPQLLASGIVASANAVTVHKKKKLSKLEQAQGWHIHVREGLPVLHKAWTKSGTVDGQFHSAGQLKTTWQVIADTGIHSYRLQYNPMYRDALRAMSEEVVEDDAAE